jgi:glutamine amidotransferase
MGNIRSVSKALERVAPQAEILVTADPRDIGAADRVVVPGQGAMPDCMRQLAASGAREAVIASTRSVPFLGICIGMQMLFERGEEGAATGLGLLAGSVPRFPAAGTTGLKVPHMGWNQVNQSRSHPLWEDIANAERFYFVHSYYPAPADAEVVAATADYGLTFTAAVARDNIFAVQFHPEKSQAAGLRLLSNFVRWRP